MTASAKISRLLPRVLASLFIVIIAVTGGIIILHNRKPVASPLSAAVRKEVSFVVYLPGSDWQVANNSAAYISNVLTLTASNSASGRLNITEQAVPDVFNDVPQYYPNLITKLNKYDSFGTVNGVVYLTHPKELSGQQQAVLNNNGTLVFVHPSQNFSNDTWRRFFNNLQLIKP